MKDMINCCRLLYVTCVWIQWWVLAWCTTLTIYTTKLIIPSKIIGIFIHRDTISSHTLCTSLLFTTNNQQVGG